MLSKLFHAADLTLSKRHVEIMKLAILCYAALCTIGVAALPVVGQLLQQSNQLTDHVGAQAIQITQKQRQI